MNLSQRVMALAESATLAVSAKAARLRAEGVDVIGFGAGEPDFDTPNHVKQAAYKAIEAGHTGYSKPASGLPAAKRAVCEKLARENDLQYSPEQVIITAGGKMCLYLAIHAVINPGDEVIIPTPYWVSYPEIVKLAGVRVQERDVGELCFVVRQPRLLRPIRKVRPQRNDLAAVAVSMH